MCSRKHPLTARLLISYQKRNKRLIKLSTILIKSSITFTKHGVPCLTKPKQRYNHKSLLIINIWYYNGIKTTWYISSKIDIIPLQLIYCFLYTFMTETVQISRFLTMYTGELVKAGMFCYFVKIQMVWDISNYIETVHSRGYCCLPVNSSTNTALLYDYAIVTDSVKLGKCDSTLFERIQRNISKRVIPNLTTSRALKRIPFRWLTYHLVKRWSWAHRPPGALQLTLYWKSHLDIGLVKYQEADFCIATAHHSNRADPHQLRTYYRNATDK